MSTFLAYAQQIGALMEQIGRNAAILADDVVGLAKPALAAADDIAALSKPAISKASAVVVDDTAVCSDQMNASAIAQDREYKVWGKIVGSSLANKAVITGVILLAGAAFPVLPQLMLGLGGCYLAIEGAHKVHEYAHHMWARMRGHAATDHNAKDDAINTSAPAAPPDTKAAPLAKPSLLDRFLGHHPQERRLLTDLILLDAILSTEILLVAHGMMAGKPALLQAAALGVVGATTTIGVYGAVLGVIRADNIAASLNNPQNRLYAPRVGRAIMRTLPHALKVVGVIGTIAMLGVGGEVLGHLVPQAMQAIGMTGSGQALHHGIEALTHVMGSWPAGGMLATTALGLGAGLAMTFGAGLGQRIAHGTKQTIQRCRAKAAPRAEAQAKQNPSPAPDRQPSMDQTAACTLCVAQPMMTPDPAATPCVQTALQPAAGQPLAPTSPNRPCGTEAPKADKVDPV